VKNTGEFMFFKKPVNIVASTFDVSYFNTCKPEYQPSEKPEWLKKLKNFMFERDERSTIIVKNPTAGLCPAIRDFLHTPIQLKMWADVDIKIFPDGAWSYYARPDWQVQIAEHKKNQYGDAYNNRVALKLSSPWYFESDQEIKFMFMESHYSTSFFRDEGIVIPPGIIDYTYQHSTNIHLSFPIRPEPYVIHLKHGTPLISMFPLTEKKINFLVELKPFDKWQEINLKMPKMFIGRYFKQPDKK
jgi:hypothetical protein